MSRSKVYGSSVLASWDNTDDYEGTKLDPISNFKPSSLINSGEIQKSAGVPYESFRSYCGEWGEAEQPPSASRHREESPKGVDIGPFFKVPNRFFGSGEAAKLGCSAGWVYIALLDQANRKGSMTFSVSDGALSADTGLGKSTLREARKRLADAGLVTFRLEPGRSPEYSLSKRSMTWKPVRERKRKTGKARGAGFGRIGSLVPESEPEVPPALKGTGAKYARPASA